MTDSYCWYIKPLDDQHKMSISEGTGMRTGWSESCVANQAASKHFISHTGIIPTEILQKPACVILSMSVGLTKDADDKQ